MSDFANLAAIADEMLSSTTLSARTILRIFILSATFEGMADLMMMWAEEDNLNERHKTEQVILELLREIEKDK